MAGSLSSSSTVAAATAGASAGTLELDHCMVVSHLLTHKVPFDSIQDLCHLLLDRLRRQQRIPFPNPLMFPWPWTWPPWPFVPWPCRVQCNPFWPRLVWPFPTPVTFIATGPNWSKGSSLEGPKGGIPLAVHVAALEVQRLAATVTYSFTATQAQLLGRNTLSTSKEEEEEDCLAMQLIRILTAYVYAGGARAHEDILQSSTFHICLLYTSPSPRDA